MVFHTPWAVGGGAEHQVEVARQQTFDATGGAEGVSRPGNLKVQPLAVPGTKVRVAPGGALLVNRYPGGEGQSYTVRNDAQVEVDVTATGSGGGRSDLVVARVLDPQYEGQPPADPDVFDYARVEVIEGVSSSTKSARDLNLNYPAIALARIDLPASTGTVQAAHITDLRELAQPRKERHLIAYNMFSDDGPNGDGRQTLSNPNGQGFPQPRYTRADWKVDVPEWAQRVKVVCTWAGVFLEGGGDTWGRVWGRIGEFPEGDPDPGEFIDTQKTSFNSANVTDNVREVWVSADDKAVPAALRGRRVNAYLRGQLDGGTGSHRPRLTPTSALVMDIEFYETAV